MSAADRNPSLGGEPGLGRGGRLLLGLVFLASGLISLSGLTLVVRWIAAVWL